MLTLSRGEVMESLGSLCPEEALAAAPPFEGLVGLDDPGGIGFSVVPAPPLVLGRLMSVTDCSFLGPFCILYECFVWTRKETRKDTRKQKAPHHSNKYSMICLFIHEQSRFPSSLGLNALRLDRSDCVLHDIVLLHQTNGLAKPVVTCSGNRRFL